MKPRVAFFGTPEFAARILRTANEAGWEIPLVVTQPDRPAGRGLAPKRSAVAETAAELGLRLLQPGHPAEALEAIQEAKVDCLVVAAYGQILPPDIFDRPAAGSVNVHASLLPQYRGASPISQAILDGEPETGVTLMRLDAGLDTGPILAQAKLDIPNDATTGTLTTALAQLGAALLVEKLPSYLSGELIPEPQPETEARITKQLTKDDGRIDWQRDADYLERHVRAMDPWPGAWTTLDGQRVAVLSAAGGGGKGKPGALTGPPLTVYAGHGSLILKRVQPAGGTAIDGDDWLNGYRGDVRKFE